MIRPGSGPRELEGGGLSRPATVAVRRGAVAAATMAATMVVAGPALAAAPTITSFSPTSGLVGTTVTINGAGFTGATLVKFAGTSATFVINSDTKITTTVPTGASTGRISVTTPSGSATSSKVFTVTGPEHPRIISLQLRRHLRVSGTVTAGYVACVRNVPVKIQRRRFSGGSWRTILRLSTDASGAYTAHVANEAGRYRSRALRVQLVSGDICLRTTSSIQRYRP
jgi:IPT/TIG domain